MGHISIRLQSKTDAENAGEIRAARFKNPDPRQHSDAQTAKEASLT